METGKFRHAIIAAIASFFALSLAFAGEDEDATAAEEDEVAAMEAVAEDAAIAEAAKEETAAIEEEEEEEELEEAERLPTFKKPRHCAGFSLPATIAGPHFHEIKKCK